MLTTEDMVEVRKMLKDSEREPIVIDGEDCFIHEIKNEQLYRCLLGEPEVE